MGSLFSALTSAAETLRTYERALTTSQNNVSNASTPGFAKQRASFVAKRFEPDRGILGGVEWGPSISTRDFRAEANVWRQSDKLGFQTQRRQDLTAVESLATVAAGEGIPGALDRLFQSFSQLSVSPNDGSARQTVLDRAGELAAEFNRTAQGFAAAEVDADRQLHSAVARVNQLGARIADLNASRRASFSGQVDTGTDAALHQTLEELSRYVNYTAVEADDGTISVFLGGQSLFVIGVNAYAVQADTSGGSAQVLSAAGDAITQYLNSGQIGALTGLRNTTLPGYRAQLNTLAQSTADAVNGQLSLGLDADGLPPAVNLFSYTPGSAAQTLTVTPGFATGQLAAAEAGAPGGNGNAIALANLATANIVNGRTLSSAYADLASTIGRDLETAALGEATAQSLVTQAQSYREEVSGVSLDEEAALMVQYQRSYQAAAQLFQIANELTETLINMGR